MPVLTACMASCGKTCLVSAGCFLLLLVSGVCGTEVAVSGESPGSVDASSRPVTLRSNSGVFLVLSPSTVTNYLVMKWAEDLAERFEQVSGVQVAESEEGALRIRVRSDPGAGGRLLADQAVAGRTLRQELTITNLSRVDQESAHEALCYLFLCREVWRRVPPDAPREERGGGSGPTPVPYWLSEGMSQNLYPLLRARARDHVVQRWQRGELGLLQHAIRLDEPRVEVTDADAGAPAVPLAYRALCGVFVDWILAEGSEAGVFEQILDRLAGGGAITATWLASRFPGAASSVAGMDEAWDQWLLRQKRVVDRPGRLTAGAVDRLKAALLLYTGRSGIPLLDDGFRRLSYGELVERRGEAWVKALCRSKQTALRLLAGGRGAAYRRTIDAYCAFFAALDRGAGEDALRELLKRARKRLGALDASLEESRPRAAP